MLIDAQIADQSLMLALAWGEDLDKPVNTRLAALHPTLTPKQLERYDTIARAAMKVGHALVYKLVRDLGSSNPELGSIFKQYLKPRYPWASDKTLDALFSQGRYYAWHDGV